MRERRLAQQRVPRGRHRERWRKTPTKAWQTGAQEMLLLLLVLLLLLLDRLLLLLSL